MWWGLWSGNENKVGSRGLSIRASETRKGDSGDVKLLRSVSQMDFGGVAGCRKAKEPSVQPG
jgi:hypothetical protein